MGIILACGGRAVCCAVRNDELMNGKVGCRCSKNYSVVFILGVWRTNEDKDMVSVLGELGMCMHGNEAGQVKTGQGAW